MNIIKTDLSKELDYIELIILSDAHIGEKQSNIKLLKERIDYIKNNPNAYCILNGDLIDNAIVGSTAESGVYNARISPMQQTLTTVNMLNPIADKILCIQTGNHELRTEKKTNIDNTQIIALGLNLLPKYSNTPTLLFLRFGSIRNGYRQRCFSVYVTHGTKAGRSVGAKANAIKSLSNIVNADIVIHSHTHMPLVFKDATYQVDYQNSTVNKKETVYVNSGTTLEYADYASRGGYPPNSTSNPIIRLYAESGDIKVEL